MTSPLLDERRLKTAMGDWARQCGKRLSERRRSLRWTQEQLAELVGVRTTTISKAELGQIVPRDHIRVAIATALCCEIADIWPYVDRSFISQVARAAAV